MNQNQSLKIYSGASAEEVAADIKPLLDFQEEGLSLEELSKLINTRLVPHFMRYDRPAFHSLYNYFPEAGAALGAKIALEYNQGVTNWQVSPGAAMTEELCGKALCRLFALGPEADATFMYCGTYANQQALYMALHRYAEQRGFNLARKGLKGFADPARLAVIVSRDAHFSLKHAVRTLGLGEESLVTVAVDQNRRLDLNQLKKTVAEIKETRDIFCVVSTAGTTSTGTIDPILYVVDLCRELRAWSHIDGAYGLAYKLVPECSGLFNSVERADSVCWDPHKQFGVPIPNSVLFVRRAEDFKRMAIFGEYFNRPDDPEPNPGLKSPPSTRPFSALPLVTAIRHLGMKKIIERLRAPLQAVKTVAENCARQPDIEICHTPHTGLLCLRLIPEGFPPEQLDQLQRYIYEKVKAECRRSISMTRLDNKTVLRLVAVSPAVTAAALMETIYYIRKLAKEYDK
ncbi:MAG: hypothetical protein AMJ79_08980 [Phycisphaerae bacterium SM23_30]|nr:MAG: hypothetical protein AMJ79_08980 [Phycisphaerae bacterium SM23_30]